MKKLQTINITFLITIVTAIIIFYSCKKNDSIKTIPDPTVTGSVAGLVTDLNNVAIVNASVGAGTSTATTDADGKFSLQNVQLSANNGLVKITKDGYFTGSRTFFVSSGTVNNVKIQLIPKTVSGSFPASSGGNINVSGGGSVNFSPGVVNATSGVAYSGDVLVSTFYLNPSNQNFNQYMPGNLTGVSAANKQGVLQSFGMVLVEMDDASGNRLQLASGKTATITLPIAAALQASAPATISLWYFDDAKSVWKQEGTATKQGNNYVGTVKHFSFWNAGELSQAVNLTATFTLDTSNIAFANKLVTITRSDSTSTNGYTDSAGTISGLVPANEVLALKVFNDCGENVYSQNIGPYSGDTNLGSISVANGSCYSSDTTQYIKMILNGTTYFWPSFKITERFQTGSFSSGYTAMFGGSAQNVSDSSTYFEGIIFGDNTSPGNYPVSIYSIVNGTVVYQAGGQSYDPGYNYPTAAITKYDAIGGYIEGTISGWIKTFPSTPTADSFPITCSYRVKRIQ